MGKISTPSTPIYDLDYFTESQFFLYIGDVWVDEITSFQYQRTQQKTPIYGYASQLFDDLAAGQVIVQGAFTINFKEQGYLWAVLRRWKNLTSSQTLGGVDPIKGRGIDKLDKALLRAGKKTPIEWNMQTGQHEAIQRQSVERVVQGDATKGEEYQLYQDLAGYASYDPKMKGKAKDLLFEDIVENFEDQIWRTEVDNEALKQQIRNPDCNVFDGFDIYAVWGNYASRPPNHTVQKFINVSLTSQGKMIKVGGGVIQEAYDWIGQTTA